MSGSMGSAGTMPVIKSVALHPTDAAVLRYYLRRKCQPVTDPPRLFAGVELRTCAFLPRNTYAMLDASGKLTIVRAHDHVVR